MDDRFKKENAAAHTDPRNAGDDTMNAPTLCPCPRCNQRGRAVSAINGIETHEWESAGTASGGGLMIGTGGLGVGFGGGTMHQSGTIQSRRAKMWDRPERFTKPVVSVILGGAFMAFSYSNMPTLLSVMNDGEPLHSGLPLDAAMDLLPMLAPVAAAAVLIWAFRVAWRNLHEEDDLNARIYPRRLARYQEIAYCDNCNILFDTSGKTAAADKRGFDGLMAA